MEKLILTLCIIIKENRILLGLKKKGLGAGHWNGFGGKVEPGESIETAARREVKEEAGIDVTDLAKAGVITFTAPDRPLIEMHIYKSTEFTGEPSESDEMRPEWFQRDEIPFAFMWSSDVYWWPLFLKNRLFTGAFEFDKDDKVVAHEVKVVERI